MTDALAPELPVLKRKDFASDQDVRWCPGCGDYAILAQVQKVLPDLGKPKEDIVFISGIGCSSRFPYYMDTYGIHSIHGRAPTLASGLKLSRPDLTVFVITGDGDALSIGGNHLLHVLRRNVDLNIILFNNRIYGLTKGQFSPTSLAGHKTKSSPMGSISQPLNPISVALAAEATFVARSIDVETKHLQSMIKAAADHKGASFLEVFQNCNIFNDGAWKFATDPSVKKEHVLMLEHGKPMVFGAERDKGIRANGMRLEVVKLGEGITEADLLVHDAHCENPSMAYALSRMTYPEFPVPIGVIRDVKKTSYEQGMLDQVKRAQEIKGEGDLASLFFSADTWTVHGEGEHPKAPERNGKMAKTKISTSAFDEMMAGWADSLTAIQQDLATDAIHTMGPCKPILCQKSSTLAEVIAMMREESLPCALVCDDDGSLCGIFTDRDILRVSLLVEDLSTVTIDRCMWPDPPSLSQELPVMRALHFLTVHGWRYVPLVDDERKPTGLITSDHVVDYISKHMK